jgi:hypothetical protein
LAVATRGVRELHIDILPLNRATLAAELSNILAVAFMERIIVVVQRAQIGYVSPREFLPGGCIVYHEIGVGAE